MTSKKTDILFELGEPQDLNDWLDYSNYQFNQDDIPELIELVLDEGLSQVDSESNDVWVPVHAWRILGQLQATQAIKPLINHLEQFEHDDWAFEDIPKVMAMMGEPAISALVDYFNNKKYAEFARIMALDALVEIPKKMPELRDRVLKHCCDYMLNPDLSAIELNGSLAAGLIDLEAAEHIGIIKQFFAKDCVNFQWVGDFEQVEIELGLRTERDTPKPNYSVLAGFEDFEQDEKPDTDDVEELLEYYLMHYGDDDSILNTSELDGFFTALGCAPNMIMVSQWFPALWGGERLMPEWEDETSFNEFSQLLFTVYNFVMDRLNSNNYQAGFLERSFEDQTTITIVDEWCEGFLKGLQLWPKLTPTDEQSLTQLTQPIRLFADEEFDEHLSQLGMEEIQREQNKIEPCVGKIYQHFLKYRLTENAPQVRETAKVGRNDPCPCGSGKKFKKCCLH